MASSHFSPTPVANRTRSRVQPPPQGDSCPPSTLWSPTHSTATVGVHSPEFSAPPVCTIPSTQSLGLGTSVTPATLPFSIGTRASFTYPPRTTPALRLNFDFASQFGSDSQSVTSPKRPGSVPTRSLFTFGSKQPSSGPETTLGSHLRDPSHPRVPPVARSHPLLPPEERLSRSAPPEERFNTPEPPEERLHRPRGPLDDHLYTKSPPDDGVHHPRLTPEERLLPRVPPEERSDRRVPPEE